MKIIYIGCVESSYFFLEALLEAGANVIGVITKKNSKYNSDFKDISPICKKYDIPIFYTQNINDNDTYNFIEKNNPDMIYCFGWSQLLNEKILRAVPNGIVGFHPAALPNNRGRHPIIWALVLGLKETASTFFMIEKEPDSGGIVSQEKIIIEYDDDAATLMEKIITSGKKQVVELWDKFEKNNIQYIEQDKNEGNYWRKRGKSDGLIDWRMSSKSIYNLVRALTKPYVGAHFLYGSKEVKVWKVEEVIGHDYSNIEPGKVLECDKEKVIVKVGDNCIKLVEYDQVELKIGDYL